MQFQKFPNPKIEQSHKLKIVGEYDGGSAILRKHA